MLEQADDVAVAEFLDVLSQDVQHFVERSVFVHHGKQAGQLAQVCVGNSQLIPLGAMSRRVLAVLPERGSQRRYWPSLRV